MIKIYPEQLYKISQKKLYSYYILFGNDSFMLQESQNFIIEKAKEKEFKEHLSVELGTNTNWEIIFNFCQVRRLFTKRQILVLILPDSVIQDIIEEKIFYIISLMHKDLLLILRFSKKTSILKNYSWFKLIKSQTVLVQCDIPKKERLSSWIINYAKNMNLTLNNEVCQTLCYSYEGNFITLVQTLDKLSLIYPDGNLTMSRIRLVINNSSRFTLLNWIDAILDGNSKRAIYILQQLKSESIDPVILLRFFQREILQLIIIKRQTSNVSIFVLLNQYKVRQSRQFLFIKALKRFTINQLHSTINIMMDIELILKQDTKYSCAWLFLKTLVLLLCEKNTSL